MICERHKLDPSACPHGWTELLSAVLQYNPNDNPKHCKLSKAKLDSLSFGSNRKTYYKKLLTSLKVENIAKNLLRKNNRSKRINIEMDNKDNTAAGRPFFRDLGFSKLQNIALFSDEIDNTTDDTSNEISVQDHFGVQVEQNGSLNYLELGYQIDFGRMQIYPPIYTPSIDRFDHYCAS
ncbi:hypothetical protein BMR1_01G02865 [Babesia microti strain RI]|uniref:Uncharacterized protein n=1 Tax=Babesia microti (strain RI) TaxID=1133968 RepID=I7J5M2_BABMR|nr:hypothetical protein BMR1_01G02865 [Babesia microti strain RI]CCF73027.1 hypothetical protein BMR1_01G02865 [Babesia microti strain RI]|eukprot:XP_012647636.1 hypothetical protein BMR1_01G02865 [Babesia microti strain RI]